MSKAAVSKAPIEAIAFDCFGTLIDFDDAAFARAYGRICSEQGLSVNSQAFFDKWMEVWQRPSPSAPAATLTNRPGPLSEPLAAAAPSSLVASATRRLDGPPPPFQPYREDWPPHFAICFTELGLAGDAAVASERLRQILGAAPAYPEARRVVETVGRRLPIAMMSNADNDFLLPSLARNGLAFPVVISSEDVAVYKPHVAVFEALVAALGVAAANVLYVGDSRTADVAGAKNAGLRAAWLNRNGLDYHAGAAGGRRRFEPDYELASLDSLLDIIDDRNAAGGDRVTA